MVATKSVTLAVMFDAPTEEIRPGRVTKYRIVRDNAPMSFGEALRSLRGDPEFRAFLTSVLASSPFDAFRWETPVKGGADSSPRSLPSPPLTATGSGWSDRSACSFIANGRSPSVEERGRG